MSRITFAQHVFIKWNQNYWSNEPNTSDLTVETDEATNNNNIPIRKPSKTKTFHDAASSKVNETISNEVNQLSTDTDTNETHDQIQDDEGQRQTT